MRERQKSRFKLSGSCFEKYSSERMARGEPHGEVKEEHAVRGTRVVGLTPRQPRANTKTKTTSNNAQQKRPWAERINVPHRAFAVGDR